MKEKVFSDWYYQTRDITARAGFDAAWQHQQAKVEELQKQVTDLDNRATQYALDEMATAKLNGELQKRVDAAKHYLGNIFTGDSIEDECHLKDLLDILDGKVVEELEQALKGGG
ncbi:hypothetical protein [Acinetobacter baumannii]|uniref:hypothetical protein n=1 Tax=Acinetobacter baumannii TaxID=470 RepID=UPI003891DEF2